MPTENKKTYQEYHGEDLTHSPRSSRKMIAVIITVIFAVIVSVLFVGRLMMEQYQSNVEQNSASLLKEYSNQVSSSVQENLNSNWDTVNYVAATLDVAKSNSESEVLSTLQKLRTASNVENINVYSEDGHEIDADGHAVDLPEASKHVYEAQKNGRYMVVVQSDIYFIVPVVGNVVINGSRIAAVSVVVNLNDFIKKMGITSFDNSSLVYLTQQNGLVISSNVDDPIINIKNLFKDGKVRSLDDAGNTLDQALNDTGNFSFIYTDEQGVKYYLAIESVEGSTDSDWNLVLEAPVQKVDHSINSYSSYLSRMYSVFAAVIGIAILLTWAFYNKQRQKNLAEVYERERMLNLLVANTNYVFALYKMKADSPVFVSSNAGAVLGENNLLEIDTEKTSQVSFKYKEIKEDGRLQDLNQELAQWDRKSEFQSQSYHVVVNGTERYFRLHLYPIVDSEAELLVIYNDTTEERQREITLEQALNMADEANKAKTKFLANMSHDIRTPMNAIVNMTDFSLQSMDDKEHLKSYLETIKVSSAHLLKLINDVLDMSRIESGKTILEREPFNIRSEAEAIGRIVEPLCENKHQQYTAEIQIEHEMIVGDSLKLRQIMINLLNNAIKFTPEQGKISLSIVENKSISENHISYTFRVKDNGIGLSEDSMQVIFEPFTRVERGEMNRVEGTGLGLSICKSFAQAMGGSIKVDSQLGKGSVFTVTLPFEIQQNAEKNSLDESADFQGRQVLLCEDNEINQTIAVMMLEKLGFKVTTAKDGKEGYTKFVSSQPYQYDLIFMDIQMPVMNGYDAAEAIRASNHPQAQKIPIIAMTANVFKEDIAHARRAGMNAHIGKPLEMKDIIRASARCLKSEEE